MYHPTTRVLTVLELLQSRSRLSGGELADRLDVDRRTVRRYIRDAKLPVSRLSTQVVRIRLADIDRFLNDNVSKPTPKAVKLHAVRPAAARFTPGPPHP